MEVNRVNIENMLLRFLSANVVACKLSEHFTVYFACVSVYNFFLCVKYMQMQDVCCDPHETLFWLFAEAHDRHYSDAAFCVAFPRLWNSVAHEMNQQEHIKNTCWMLLLDWNLLI